MSVSDPPEIQRLPASPRLPAFAAFLTRFLEEETARRMEFYRVVTEEHKMEFINGETVIHPAHRDWHLVTQKYTMLLLDNFVRQRRLGVVHSGKCLCVFPRNDYEPDVVYFGPGKSATFEGRTEKFPVPDLSLKFYQKARRPATVG